MVGDLSPALQQELGDAIQREVTTFDNTYEPTYYGVVGSYLYGTATSDSDIDVRGFHCAPGVQYMLFDEPASQISAKLTLPESEYELDFVSYELREFGRRIAASNFTVVELLYSDQPTINRLPSLLDALRTTVAEYDYLELQQRYLGMARSIWSEERRDGASDADTVSVERSIYALRGVLAAQHLSSEGTVEPNIERLAQTLLGPQERSAIEDLLQANEQAEQLERTSALAQTIAQIIERGLANLVPESLSTHERDAYRDDIAEWMVAVRKQTNTR